MRFAWPLTFLALALVLTAPPAEAQLFRVLGVTETDGEPTDPDGALHELDAIGVVLEDHGLSATQPVAEEEASAWWQAIIDLLIELGFLEEEANR